MHALLRPTGDQMFDTRALATGMKVSATPPRARADRLARRALRGEPRLRRPGAIRRIRPLRHDALGATAFRAGRIWNLCDTTARGLLGFRAVDPRAHCIVTREPGFGGCRSTRRPVRRAVESFSEHKRSATGDVCGGMAQRLELAPVRQIGSKNHADHDPNPCPSWPVRTSA